MPKHYHPGDGHLYSLHTKHSFEKEYGKSRGDEIFGKVVGKIKRARGR